MLSNGKKSSIHTKSSLCIWSYPPPIGTGSASTSRRKMRTGYRKLRRRIFGRTGKLHSALRYAEKGESDIPLPEGNPQKVSLKIDINALVPGQRWRGLTKLSLENGSTDPLNEGFAWVVHQLASGMYGYDAANAAWVKVYINGQFKGVLINAEQRNEQFLRTMGITKREQPGFTRSTVLRRSNQD